MATNFIDLIFRKIIYKFLLSLAESPSFDKRGIDTRRSLPPQCVHGQNGMPRSRNANNPGGLPKTDLLL